MKIRTLHIKNFRSIKELTINPENLCVLVGPNSSGKTNILKAIDLVLGEGWVTKAKVAKELFNDVNQPVIIEIEFDETISFVNEREYDVNINKIELSMTLTPDLTVTKTINGGQKFWDQEPFKRLCHFIYIPADRNLSDEMRISNWTLLGKLMKLVYDNYVKYYEAEDKLKEAFEKEIEPAKIFLEKDFDSNLEVITFKNFVDTFKKYCEENSSGLASSFEPKLNIYNLNWFYKTLQLHIKESEFSDKDFDAEEVGAGMKNLLLISIFQTYAELMGGKVIFGIEEPEIYLYPQAQRSLFKSFQELSENSQIFYTTHSPNLVDPSRAYEIEPLRKNRELGTFNLEKDSFISKENLTSGQFKIYTQFNNERNELFFANKVILVEGNSDKIFWQTICQKWSFNIDKMGISIIECGGKGGVNYFVGVCKLIGLKQFFSIWDQDDENFSPEVNYLETLDINNGLEIVGNLEKFLGLPEGDKVPKVKNAYEKANNLKLEEIPEAFDVVKNFISSSINHGTAAKEIKEVDNNGINDDEINIEDIPF